MTDEEIDRLLTCRKIVKKQPASTPLHRDGSARYDFIVESEDGEYQFYAFARQNLTLSERFSIGLLIQRGGTDIILFRCNGPHWTPVPGHKSGSWHFFYHTHTATAENLAKGAKPEHGGVQTTEFSSFKKALRHFVSRCKIETSGTLREMCLEELFPGE